jgi:hypothetical protein
VQVAGEGTGLGQLTDAMIVLTWFAGFLFGALWTSALEREEHKRAQLYARSMASCYFLCFLSIIASSL